jgi:hypothetical protein
MKFHRSDAAPEDQREASSETAAPQVRSSGSTSMDDPDATGAVRSGARLQKRRRISAISAAAYGGVEDTHQPRTTGCQERRLRNSQYSTIRTHTHTHANSSILYSETARNNN